MRTALVSLIALAGLATTAVAQPAETPPAQPQAPAPAAPPAPPAATPPASTPPVDSGSAPAAAAPAPAAPDATTPTPTQPAATRPTSGDAAVVLDAIERICVPLVKGGNVEQLAKAYGMRKQRDRFVATFGAKPYTIALEPQGSNKDTCVLNLEHRVGGDEEIAKALHTWSYLHQPELKPYRSDIRDDAVTGNKLTTRSWEHFTNTDSIGLVYVKETKADGSPAGRNGDRSRILYQERKLAG